MVPVSKEYKKEIYTQTKDRNIEARVRFEIVDDEAYKDVSVILPPIAPISPLGNEQIINRVRTMQDKYATFEQDYFKLDGSFKIPPTNQEVTDNSIEMGYWSDDISDEFGIFEEPLKLEFNFAEKHSSIGLTLYFDILNNEYATEFDVFIYSDSTIIYEANIIDNIKPRYTLIENLKDYNRIEIMFKRWSNPYRRCKIAEIDFGVVFEYTDDELIKLNILQELDPVSEKLPSDEVKFTIDNSDKLFNPLNSEGIYEFLTKGQNVFVEMGLEVYPGTFEMIPVGKYYLSKWKSDEGTITSTFTARDVFDVLGDREVAESTIKQNTTLYDLAEKIMLDNNINDYKITENLKKIKTNGIYQKMSYRNLLRLIIEAGKCIAYTDNYGTLHIKEMVTVTNVPFKVNMSEGASLGSVKQLTNGEISPGFNFASFEKDRFKLDGSFQLSGIEMDAEVGWWSSQISNENGIFETPIKIEFTVQKEHFSKNINIIFDEINGEYPSSISIEAYNFNNELKFIDDVDVQDANFIYFNNELENTSKIVITIPNWNTPNRRARIVEVGFDVPVDNITFDNVYKEPQIEIESSIRAVKVTYYANDLSDGVIYTAINNNVEDGKTLKVENSLINTEEHAREVAEWLLRESEKTAIFNINWRQNPALTLTDKVAVENGYSTLNSSNITRQEFEYAGYLKGKTRTKGLI